MMVYFPVIIIPESVHVCVDQNHNEGVEQVEQQPGIHHLHVGGLWQAVTHVDKHRRQHKHRGEINCDNCLKIDINSRYA